MPCTGSGQKWKVSSDTHWRNWEGDTISLTSDDVTCRGGDPILTVTGKDVSWYADAQKGILLAKGNTYHSAPLDKTTVFYVTQKINGIESDAKAITIDVVEAILDDLQTKPADCGKTNGAIMVKGRGGTSRYPVRFKLDDGPLQTESTFAGLAPGTYKLTLQAGKCAGSIDVEVGQQPIPTISYIDYSDPRCGKKDGSVHIAAYGGNGALTYSLNGIDFFASNIFTDLPGGSYNVTVRDDSLCSVSQELLMEEGKGPVIGHIDLDQPGCNSSDGRIRVSAAAPGSVTFSLNSGSYQGDSLFTGLSAGDYIVTVRDDNGCMDQRTVRLEKTCGNAVSLPSAFTPNGDGINDGWVIYFPSPAIEIEEITLFNRWGEVVLQSSPGKVSSGSALWDGKYKGQVVRGVFVYKLLIKRSGQQQSHIYRGIVSVL